jgi:hypothetical protein
MKPEENAVQQDKDKNLVIEPQAMVTKPALAVKGPSGNYSQYLSIEEKEAMELLFARYRDISRFSMDANGKTENKNDEHSLGRLLDVKV